MMESNNDDRPAWSFNQMSEDEFRAIHKFGMVVSVTGMSELTGVDTSLEWLVVKNSNGKTMKLPDGWKSVIEFVGFSYFPGLFKLTYLGERMRGALDAIDKWEEKNKRERKEFERLKKKFGENTKPPKESR